MRGGGSRAVWLILVLLALANVVLALIPVAIVLPLRAQTPAMLSAAYLARTWAAVLAVGSLACGLGLTLFGLHTRRARVAAGLLMVPLIAALVLARTSYVEWMFAPARDAIFVPIATFGEIRDDDMVIGVVVGSDSRAYPVRYLAYHHMLNDQLGGRPILPNY